MILLVHMLVGAAIGSAIKNPPLAIILSVLAHYLTDIPPHIEYSISNIAAKKWKKSGGDFLKVFADFFIGILLIFILSNKFICYICAIASIIPDGFLLAFSLFNIKLFKRHAYFHREQVHFLKYKKIPVFWRIFSQITTVLVAVFTMIKY